MHPNPIFRQITNAENLAFVRDRSFRILSMNADPVPLLAHIPFVLSPDESYLDFHLVRSNPIARAIGSDTQAVLAVSGSDGYISPDWYGIPDQVPTWNYLSLELEGPVRTMEREGLIALIDDVVAHNEAKLAPKPEWHRDKMNGDMFEKMLDSIVGFEMEILAWRPTAKFSQNKPDAARKKAAEALDASGRRAVAHMMREFGGQ